jgi:hypothetical protein
MAPLHHVKNLVVVVGSSVTTGGATEEEKMRMVGELPQIAALISGVGCKLKCIRMLTVGQSLL